MTNKLGRKVPYIIDDINTHECISIDEWTAYFLVENFGADYFEISRDCKITVNTDTDVSDFFKEQELRKQGKLFLGVGGGQFDEHPCYGANRKERKENECCATLVAKFLGIDKDPALQYILRIALNDDQGIGPKDEAGKLLANEALPKIIKAMYTNAALDTEQMKYIVFTILSELYEEQRIFFSSQAVLEKGKTYKFKIPERKDKSYSMVIVETDHLKVQDYIFSKTWHQLVLKISPTGNWQLFVRRKSPLHIYMPALAGMIRLKEARLNRAKINSEDLQLEGSIPGAKTIHFFKKSGMISNGTLTYDVPPSRIDPRDIPALLERILMEAKRQVDEKTQTSNAGNQDIETSMMIPPNEDMIVHQTVG